MDNKKLIVLVGLPASGKSTWLKNTHPNAAVISTDNYIELVAEKNGQTYDEAFGHYIKEATAWMSDVVKYHLRKKRPMVIWDQTNLSLKKRRYIINLGVKAGYDVSCVIFTVEDSLLQSRLGGRVGKTIPAHIMNNMKKSYQEPTTDEGFSSVTHIHSKT